MAASTTIIADLKSARDTGPSAASEAKAIAAAGPITDLKGMLDLAVVKAQELKIAVDQIQAVLDSGDGIKTAIDDVDLSLA